MSEENSANDGLLESTDGGRLEAEVRFKALSDFADNALEGGFVRVNLNGQVLSGR